ncbi:MAG: ABC transporter permease [Roseburia sp.]|nr:ABC transporter permease [Roseburia sp.]
MKAVLLCALAKLRRKKIPNLLLWLCIFIMTVLLVNVFILLKELDTIFDRAYEEMAGPQMCCLWSREVISPDAVSQYLDSWREDLFFQITDNTKTIEYMEKDGVKLSNGILLELPEMIDEDMISPRISGGEIQMPGRGEIWVTTKMASILNLKAGDDITLQLADKSVTVSVVRIVADPVFGGSSTNVYRMWCGFGQLSEFPLAENNAVSYLEIRFREYSPQAEQKFIHDAEVYFDMPLGDSIYTYDRIKGGYTAPYQMIGAALCLVSVILAGMMTLLTLFLIKSDRNEDIRNIGLYKSLGMTGVQITGVYIGCYGMIGIMGAIPGSILGGRVSQGIISKILGDIGIYAVSFAGIGIYQLVTGILVPAVIIMTCFAVAVKAGKLNASYAVRTGFWQSGEQSRQESGNAFYHGGISFELYYALKGIQNKKLRYAYMAGAAFLFGCLMVVCQGCLNAVQNIDREPEIWGFIKTDIYVTSLEDMPVSDIIKELENDTHVIYTYGVNKVTVQYKPADKDNWQNMVTEVYELPWQEEVKDRSLYGRRPLHENEIGIGLSLAREYGLEIGDSMELVVNGKKGQYEITGIFQTLSNYGNIIRMVTDDLDQFVKAEGVYADYMLVLADGIDKWEFAEELAERYEGKFSFIASKSNGENIAGILAPAVGTILTILLVVAALITVNLTFLLIRREQKMIGLLKAIGMTPLQIVRIYSLRNGLSAFVGNSLGIMAGIFVMPGLLTPYVRSLGLSEFPFVNSPARTIVSFLLLPVCMILSTYAVTKTISRVSVKQLVSI